MPLYFLCLTILIFGLQSFVYAGPHKPMKLYTGHHLNSHRDSVRFYLDETWEDERHVFRLFEQNGDHLQDLRWQKSFTTNHEKEAQLWLQNTISLFNLQSNQLSLQENQFNVPVFEQQRQSSNYLWIPENVWNENWEAKFGQWVSENLTPHFMVDINLPTDCADVAYTLRWVFARIHKLPMAVRLGGSGQFFTNETVKPEWLQLPTHSDWKQDKRFRAALEFILRNTYTHTLMKDSYPVAINTTYFTPGTHHLTLFGVSGHTMLVDSVNKPNQLPITLLFSTTPIEVRELIPTFYQETDSPKIYQSGFYKIRWPQKINGKWSLLEAKSIPGYSEEQFKFPDDSQKQNTPHFLKLYKRLNPEFSFELMLSKSYEELKDRLTDRIKIVEDGFNFCSKNDCSPGSAGDEDWSTPSRDRRLLQLQQSFDLAAGFLGQFDADTLTKWKERIKQEAKTKNFLISGVLYSLEDILIVLNHKLIQPDPRLSVQQRWSLSLEGLISNLTLFTQAYGADRQSRIEAAAPCRIKACEVKSDIYKKLNTADIDSKLPLQWLGAQRLCALRGQNECQELKLKLSQSHFNNQTIYENLQRSAFWISNPNAPIESRWGTKGQILTGNGESSAFFNRDKSLLIFNHKLFSGPTFRPISPSGDETLGSLHFGSDHFFTYKRTDNEIIIKIYQAPQKLLVEKHLPIKGDAPIRIWWTNPTLATLSIFTPNEFVELDLSGNLINQRPYDHFKVISSNPQFTLIETKQGLFFSDASLAANKFMLSPLTLAEWKEINFVNKTEKGYFFSTFKRFIYAEDKNILIDWTFQNYANAYISPQSDMAFRLADNGREIQIFARQPGKGGSPATYTLIKTIPGQGIYGFDKYLTIWDGENRSETYQLPNLDKVQLPCVNPKSGLQIMTKSYYQCATDDTRELHHISGSLIYQEKGYLGWWNLLDVGEQLWLTNFRWDETQSLPAEVFAITPNHKLVGPILQTQGENMGIMVMSSGGTISTDDNLEIAPSGLNPWQKNNGGLIHSVPSPYSFILNEILKLPAGKHFLFMPELN